jgi:hypothetical protein
VQEEKLSALVTLLEAITVRVTTLGLSRTAEDLRRITTELRRMRAEVGAANAGSAAGPSEWPVPQR